MSRNYGDQFVDSVKEYMRANELEKVNWTLMADLAQRFQEKFTGAQKTKRKLECEEEWLRQIESDPVTEGIDVRREFGKAQFWCRERKKVCTRRFFTNWLLKAEKTVGVYDGQTSRPKPVSIKPSFTPETPVPGWPLLLRREIDDVPEEKIDQLCSGDWAELPLEIREKIIKVS